MQYTILNWDSAPTQVIATGRWIEESIPQIGKKDLVIVITGNPGIAGFYEGFINILKSRLPTEVPVWVIGHAGHVQPTDNLAITIPNDSMWQKGYGLTAQIQHKKNFINKYVPKDAKVHLIGHSIGCWMTLNMLKDATIAARIKKCYLLFPTIEHMAVTKNGWFFNKIISTIAPLLITLCWIFSCFPVTLQNFILRTFAPLFGVPTKYNSSVRQLLHPQSLKNVLKLADEEMKAVKKRDDDIITQYQNKLWFYYGNCDDWVPVKYYEDLKSKHPNINAELCKYGYQHTFVLQYEKEVANLVGDVINENML